MVVDAKSLKSMVGPCGLEPQTSTVSIASPGKGLKSGLNVRFPQDDALSEALMVPLVMGPEWVSNHFTEL
jgi:hypothetical protein